MLFRIALPSPPSIYRRYRPQARIKIPGYPFYNECALFATTALINLSLSPEI
tara:strand:+ start:100 stop:255 length:156 start_codon:yes stop_codon:yes gene_type:complete